MNSFLINLLLKLTWLRKRNIGTDSVFQARKNTDKSQAKSIIQEFMKKNTLFKGFISDIWIVIVLEKNQYVFLFCKQDLRNVFQGKLKQKKITWQAAWNSTETWINYPHVASINLNQS